MSAPMSASATPESGSEGAIEGGATEEGTEETPAEVEPEKREAWGSTIAYILTLVGYAVGFGNIWRFPFRMRENGGFAFMIPYCFMLAVVGIPVFFLELAVGQRRRKGVCYAWNEISPAFGGIGMACGWICFFIGLYYNTLLAYCISYLIDSFISPLPWTSCSTAANRTVMGSKAECEEFLEDNPSKYYWYRGVLDISQDEVHPGRYSWQLGVYHAIAWGLVWLILWKGTELIGRVVYFTAVFPYLVLIIFFIANLIIEPGRAWLGAWRLLKPNWRKLLRPITWLRAGSQIFFSLGLGYGCLVVFASYTPARNNCHKDAVAVSLINCGTSVFAAIVVFPMIGALGFRNYESCFEKISRTFPQIHLHDPNISVDHHYDIYFATNAKTWDDLYKNGTYIRGRFGFGEMTDDEKNNLEKEGEREDEQFIDFKYLIDPNGRNVSIGADSVANQRTGDGNQTTGDANQSTNGTENGTNIDTATARALAPVTASKSLKPFHLVVRDCSIGKEATASGDGPGFIFVAFTEAATHITGGNFFSVIFFFMLIQLGIDSAFGTVEGAVGAFEDLTKFSRAISASVVCGILAVLALLLFPFGYGNYVLTVMDDITANWTLLVIALVECIAVAWSYGLARFAYDVKLMTGSKPNLYILLCWKYITPAVILIMLLGSIGDYIADAVKDGGIKHTVFILNATTIGSGQVSDNWHPVSLLAGYILLFFCMAWLPIHYFLRRTRFNMLVDTTPGDFPEEELRAERNINVEKEADQFTPVEKIIMGGSSLQNLQEYRDARTSSQTELHGEGRRDTAASGTSEATSGDLAL